MNPTDAPADSATVAGPHSPSNGLAAADGGPGAAPVLSAVLNVMGRVELAAYGFRSWMLQDARQPYEVVLNLFNDQRPLFDKLAGGRNPNCRLVVNAYEKPKFFNISVANNLGLHAATGRYVFFVNSDMIYPSGVARKLSEDLPRLGVGYAFATRANLSERMSKDLKPVEQYGRPGDLDEVEKLPIEKHEVWVCGSGWLARRDVARAVGGFDRRVRCSEDSDFSERVLHYLRRQGLQQCSWGLTDVRGYHVYHPGSELFNTFEESWALIRARGDRLNADPDSTEDVVPTDLDSREALVEDLRQTPAVPRGARFRRNVPRKVARRIKEAFNVLIHRR